MTVDTHNLFFRYKSFSVKKNLSMLGANIDRFFFTGSFLMHFRKIALYYLISSHVPTWSLLPISQLNLKLGYINTVFSKKNKFIFLAKVFDDTDVLSNLVLKLKKDLLSDFILNSLSISYKKKTHIGKVGIIFVNFTYVSEIFEILLNSFLGIAISPSDNFFASLNSAFFSDGSFIYVPKNTLCPIQLSAYFYISFNATAQLERTLIICEDNSEVSYLESCNAKKNDERSQLHAAVVEIVAFSKSTLNYTTIQNWYASESKSYRRATGILNLVTKRGICFNNNSCIRWLQVEIGSTVTWKYPSTILYGHSSKSFFYSLSMSIKKQKIETGTKVIHFGSMTASHILAKSISKNEAGTVLRILGFISKTAVYAKIHSNCDSFVINTNTCVITYPIFEISEPSVTINHEAKMFAFEYEHLFYLQQRGIPFASCQTILINRFFKPIFEILAVELQAEIKQTFLNYGL